MSDKNVVVLSEVFSNADSDADRTAKKALRNGDMDGVQIAINMHEAFQAVGESDLHILSPLVLGMLRNALAEGVVEDTPNSNVDAKPITCDPDSDPLISEPLSAEIYELIPQRGSQGPIPGHEGAEVISLRPSTPAEPENSSEVTQDSSQHTVINPKLEKLREMSRKAMDASIERAVLSGIHVLSPKQGPDLPGARKSSAIVIPFGDVDLESAINTHHAFQDLRESVDPYNLKPEYREPRLGRAIEELNKIREKQRKLGIKL